MMRPPPPRVSRLLVVPSAAAALATTFNTRHVAITPDGTRLVYTGPDSTLFVRAMGQLDGTLLTGVGRPAAPFVSPDGQWIGFDGDNPRGGFDLKKIAITGGPAVTLCKLDAGLRGATWGPDDTIVFATVSVTTGLQQVPAGGGEPTVLTRPDLARGEGDHLWPEFLPGGQAVLFTITSGAGLDQAQVAVLDLRTRTQTTLIRGGSDAHYVPSGHLVYGAEGTLRAVGFDLAQLAVVGTPVPVVSQVVTTNTGAVDVAVAADGTLVYIPGTTAASAQRTLVWVDRTGKEESIALKPRAYNALRFSPDGTRVAMFIGDEENDIWLWDLARASLTQLTFDRLTDYFPVWTPNGRRIVFASQREGNGQHLWWQASDGTGVAERLITSTNDATTPTDISPDGTHLIFYHRTPTASRDLMRLEMLSTAISGPGDAAEPRRVSPLLQTPFDEQSGFVSPDGRWLAYQSNSSGRFEIYVRPFPNTLGGQWRVSNGGGRQPLWARSGEELFFLGADNALMRVGVETKAATWTATTPTKLLDIKRYFNGVETQPARMYDISADDQRFLMIKPSGGSESTPAPTSLVVVQHFDEELKRLVPTER